MAGNGHKRAADSDRETVRIGRHLSEVITIRDEAGNILHKITKPLMVEFYARDLAQVIVGATLLGFPVAVTEEVWKLGVGLSLFNTLLLLVVSLLFISLFAYFNYYQNRTKFSDYVYEFVKRVVFTYGLSMLVAVVLLTILQQFSWDGDLLVGFKRVIIVAFPASLSAAVADGLK
jgi:uncharacterized membrane protein